MRRAGRWLWLGFYRAVSRLLGVSASQSTLANSSFTGASGTLTYTAKDSSGTVVVGAPVTATVNAEALVSASLSTLDPDTPSIETTTGTANITAYVYDTAGDPVVGFPLALMVLSSTGSNNTITAVDSVTNYQGRFRWTFSSTTSEVKTVTLTVASLAITDTVTLTVAAAGGGTATTVTDISRDASSAAGGAEVTITGTGFSGVPSVTFGGTAATGISVDSATSLRCLVPAHVVGIVAVEVAGVGLTNPRSALVGGDFEYILNPVTTYVTHGFEDSTDGGFITETNGSNTVTFPTTYAKSGTRAARCYVPISGGSTVARIGYQLTGNPFLTSTIFVRYYVYVPSTTATNAQAGGTKLHLLRPNLANNYGYWHAGIGGEFSGTTVGQHSVLRDGDTANVTANMGDLRDVWTEIQMSMTRSGGLGTVKYWVNGRCTSAPAANALYGSDDANADHNVQLGIVYTQNSTGDQEIFLDACTVANGWVEPV